MVNLDRYNAVGVVFVFLFLYKLSASSISRSCGKVNKSVGKGRIWWFYKQIWNCSDGLRQVNRKWKRVRMEMVVVNMDEEKGSFAEMIHGISTRLSRC